MMFCRMIVAAQGTGQSPCRSMQAGRCQKKTFGSYIFRLRGYLRAYAGIFQPVP